MKKPFHHGRTAISGKETHASGPKSGPHTHNRDTEPSVKHIKSGNGNSRVLSYGKTSGTTLETLNKGTKK